MRTETKKQEDGSRSLYYYDDDNKEMRVEDYDTDGNIYLIIERQYNNEGNCSGWVVKDGSGTLIKRFVVKFDENGNETCTEQYDSAGVLEGVVSANGDNVA